MSWLVNLLMLGKGSPPNLRSFTRLSLNGGPGRPYTIAAKTSSTVASVSPYYFYRFVAGLV